MARKSADERREQIVEIAMGHFAEGGYHGTSTEAIANEAGISQPYLFRLFGTKRDLFLACVDRCHSQIRAVFEEAAAAAPDGEKLTAMGHAYTERLLPDRHALLLQVQGYATNEPVIRAHVRENFDKLIRIVARLAGVSIDETWDFFADGMLLNVVAMLELDWMPTR
jgi:AcrR family transcriptional regulator